MTAVEDLFSELQGQLSASVQFLSDKPEESAESTLRALWLNAQGMKCSAVRAMNEPLRPLTSQEAGMLRTLVARRMQGEPLSHIVGRQHFMGLEMLAGPGALVPRAETQLLARIALEIAESASPEGRGLEIVDVCTGSGNIALALAHHLIAAHVSAADLSAEAVALAEQNARHLGLSGRTAFRSGDLLEPFRVGSWRRSIDLLTCNPPYISTAKVGGMAREIMEHEPSLAFDGGPFGVSILLRLLKDAPAFLKAGGWLVFEVGLGQGAAMVKRVGASGSFDLVRPHADEAGDIRAISARRNHVEDGQ